MNTDRLIDVLSANLEPVQRGQLGKLPVLAMVTGEAAAFGLMLITVGPRGPNLIQRLISNEWR